MTSNLNPKYICFKTKKNRNLGEIKCEENKKKKLKKNLYEDEDYLQDLTWSPGVNSVSSTTNFCNLDNLRKNPKRKSFTFNLDENNLQQLDGEPQFQNIPEDKYNLIYFSLLFSGIGFLLPYNSFIISVDYFQDHFPNTTIVFDISFIYIIISFFAVCINNSFVNLISFKWRILIGYILSFTTLLIVTIFEIGYNLFSNDRGYKLNLICVSIVAFGCTIQQSSFYGFTSMLPQKFTQAVMTGESAAGLIISLTRIGTKLFVSNQQLNTLFFFSISLAILFCCILAQFFLQRSFFIRYHINICNKKTNLLDTKFNNQTNHLTKNLTKEQNINIELIVTFNKQAGLTSIQQEQKNVPKSDSTEFDMPFGIDDEDLMFCSKSKNVNNNLNKDYSSSISSNLQNQLKRSLSKLELEKNLIDQEDENEEFNCQNVDTKRNFRINRTNEYQANLIYNLKQIFCSKLKLFQCLTRQLKQGLINRYKMCKLIWPYMLSICLIYFVTLSIFPGLESEINNCKLKSWTPVVLITFFNLTDLIGKILSIYFYNISMVKIIIFSLSRSILLPLFLFCIVPFGQVFFKNFFWPLLFTCILGLSNGIFGSLPLILVSKNVSDDKKELTGNLMTLSYSVGLTSGSLLAYLINKVWFAYKIINVHTSCN